MTKLLSHTLPPNNEKKELSIFDRFVGGCAISIIFCGIFLGPFTVIILLWLLLKGYYNLVAAGLFLVLLSMALADHSPRFCRFFLRSAGYFTKGVTLHIEKEFIDALAESHIGTMWCMHPHGTSLGFGFILNGAVRFRAHDESKFVHPIMFKALGKRLRLANGVQAPVLFKLPILRNMMMACGCCTPATKSEMFGLFRRNEDFGILPGGMEEVSLYQKGRERVFVKNRAGFIKYALQHGYLITPCYTFGESDLYDSNNVGLGLRMWVLRKFGFVIPVFWGPFACYGLPWLPRSDIAINTVVGKHIQLPKIENPSNDETAKYHQLYISHLTDLFNTYKNQFGYNDRELEIL